MTRDLFASITPMGRAALEVGFCAAWEPRRQVIRRVMVIPAAPTPSLDEWLASLPTVDETIADVVRVNEEWERELSVLLRAKA